MVDYVIRTKNHEKYVQSDNKLALNAFDDKQKYLSKIEFCRSFLNDNASKVAVTHFLQPFYQILGCNVHIYAGFAYISHSEYTKPFKKVLQKMIFNYQILLILVFLIYYVFFSFYFFSIILFMYLH